MSKSVTYSVVPRKNLLKKDEPAKYYAQAQASGDVEVKEMAKRIEKACTVTRADVMAVLIALEDTIVEGLERGDRSFGRDRLISDRAAWQRCRVGRGV